MFNWKKDIAEQSIDTLLLLDERQLLYFPKHAKRRELALVLKTRPYILWYIKNKAPEMCNWIDSLLDEYKHEPIPSDMESIEKSLICSIEDWVIYVTTPDDYHNQPFMDWDESELTRLTNYSGKTVVDIGSGTGKQAFAVASLAKYVYCVEPVSNLRKYLRNRAKKEDAPNIYVVDGLLEEIPFNDEFADVTMCGHVFGDMFEAELSELERITKKNGLIILCPGNIDKDNECHDFLTKNEFKWSRFLEPGDSIGSGYKRKYWKKKL